MAAFNLSDHLIPGTDESYYIPNFVSEQEEEYLIRKILESPTPKWKVLANRRLQLLGGTVSTSKQTLIAAPMPAYVTSFPDLISRLRDLGIFSNSAHKAPNHIILNEYLAGQGIMPHEDGPSYHPVVATISLGSHAVFHYYKYKDADSEQHSSPTPKSESTEPTGRSISPNPVLTVLLEPRSLIITKSQLYTGHLHGIDEISSDRIHVDKMGRARAAASPDGQLEEVDEDGMELFLGEGRQIANAGLVVGQEYRDALRDGGVLRRGTRWSLTCRDVEKVVRVNALFGRK